MRQSTPARALRLWLIALNLVLMGIALALAAAGTRRALFIVLLVPVGFLPFAYARLRLHRALADVFDARGMAAIAVLGAVLDVITISQLLAARAAEVAQWLSGPAIGWVGPVWFSAHALLFLSYAVLGLVRLGRRGARRALRRPAVKPTPNTTGDGPLLGRREFLAQYGVVGAAAPFAVSLSGVPMSYDFRVDEHEITLPNWPRELDGLRVAHLSDIHVGGGMDRQRLQRVAELTNETRPDLVVHTGDFLTHRNGDFDAPLYEALAQIRAPYGQWACLGNHDFDDPDRLTRKLGDAGVTVLRNRVAPIDVNGHPLEIAGLDFVFGRGDRDAGYTRVIAAMPQPQAPRLLLNHDPRGFAGMPDGCADLVLSGHTHGGHIGVQLTPGHALTVVGLAGIPDQGVFTRGDLRLFVTRCVGFYGYPMRVGIPPEIALLVLRAPRRSTAV